MYFEICVVVALAVMLVFAGFAIKERHTASKCISMILLGICVSSIFLFFPVYWADSAGVEYQPFRAAVFSLYYGAKALAGGQEIRLLEKYKEVFPAFRFVFLLLNYVYFLAAPLLTSSLILSFMGDFLDRFRYRFSWKRNYYIFSELSASALHAARQIHKRHPKGMIVFCGTKNADKTNLAKARALGAVNLYAACEALRIPFKGKNLEFHLLSEDEDQNLGIAEQLIVRHRDKTGVNILINAFAESGTGIQVVESIDKGGISVRFIDSTALLCNNLLLKYPLYELPADQKTISVALVGCGKTGIRMLKTIAWCGQMEDIGLKIRIYDNNAARIGQKVLAQCPELQSSHDIAFVETDVETAAFEVAVLDPEQGSRDATYVVVALGDDEQNIAVAERLFRIFRHANGYRWTPRILARIRSGAKSVVYSHKDNSFLEKRRICLFGDMEEVLSSNTLFHSYLERLALAVNLSYSDLLPDKDADLLTELELLKYFGSAEVRACCKSFLDSEYSRRSSMASALHIPVKLHNCGLLPAGEIIPSDETVKNFYQIVSNDPQLMDKLAKNEHRRWNSFMRSEGYCTATWEDLQNFYPVLEKKNNQDQLTKRHLCLVDDWDQLDDLYSKYMSLNPPYKPDFKDSDRKMIENIHRIVMLANRLERTSIDEFFLS